MDLQGFAGYFLAIQIISFVFTVKFYIAAGYKWWEAAIPVYKTVILLKIIQRPVWWLPLFLVPVINNVMAIIAAYELLYRFGFKKTYHTVITIITFGLYMGYLSFSSSLKLEEKDSVDIKKRLGETIPALIFAVVVASVIRFFTFEAYTIPTPSMEKSMMVGDFLFVSKMHYGTRMPTTPLAIPLMHDRIPLLGVPSYLSWFELPYVRLPKLQSIKRNEPFVFNYPMDTHAPLDKRMNYVKRCVGIPGDSLEIRDQVLYINNREAEYDQNTRLQFQYYVRTNGQDFNKKILKDRFDIYYGSVDEMRSGFSFRDVERITANEYFITIAEDLLPAFAELRNVEEIVPLNALSNSLDYADTLPKLAIEYLRRYHAPSERVFPNPDDHSRKLPFEWTRDNYGPVWIPAKGESVELNLQNYYIYRRAIEVYEGNELEFDKESNSFIINGEKTNTYTFKYNYYWAMGDNRHNSEDSRFWGFVPEDHVLGKPVFVWMSYDKFQDSILKRVRTERVFTLVNASGTPRSYFPHFLIIALLAYGFSKWRKRRKQTED
jgi:signal peptidase I